MNCMKCGRDISAGQVFCNRCLDIMEQYPVKPDAAIHLPHRQEQDTAKKAGNRKRPLQPEEQVLLLQKRCRILLICLLISFLLLAASAAAILHYLPGDQVALPIGRNYTIDPQG